MRSFRHRRGRIIFEILAALLLASIAGARFAEGGAITSLVATLGLTVYGLYRIGSLFVRNPALAYGNEGVQVGGLLAVKDYRWQLIRDIRETVWKRPYIPFMHWLPKERHYLEIEMNAGGKVKLRSDMMELPPNGVKEVIEGFRAAQVAALGDRGAAMARLGAKDAQQAAAPLSGVQAERMRRLGLGSDDAEPASGELQPEAPVPHGAAMQRPVFGRKVS
jgi:hypothetical protein